MVFAINVSAQEGFSVKAGYNNVTLDIDGFGSESEGGVYFGAAYTFDVDESWDIEPSVLYSLVDDLNALYIPVMAKYQVADKFKLQAGPQINYILEDDVDDGAFGIDIALGASYDISEQFFAEVRYGFEVVRDIDDANINTLSLGIGYHLN